MEMEDKSWMDIGRGKIRRFDVAIFTFNEFWVWLVNEPAEISLNLTETISLCLNLFVENVNEKMGKKRSGYKKIIVVQIYLSFCVFFFFS